MNPALPDFDLQTQNLLSSIAFESLMDVILFKPTQELKVYTLNGSSEDDEFTPLSFDPTGYLFDGEFLSQVFGHRDSERLYDLGLITISAFLNCNLDQAKEVINWKIKDRIRFQATVVCPSHFQFGLIKNALNESDYQILNRKLQGFEYPRIRFGNDSFDKGLTSVEMRLLNKLAMDSGGEIDKNTISQTITYFHQFSLDNFQNVVLPKNY